MDFKGVKYQFKAKVWRYDGPNGWYFVTLPKDYSKEIRATMRSEEEGWGRLKATASIGSSEWKTAIWFDTKSDAYLLAIKAQIRSDEEIDIGKIVNVTVWI